MKLTRQRASLAVAIIMSPAERQAPPIELARRQPTSAGATPHYPSWPAGRPGKLPGQSGQGWVAAWWQL